MMATYTYTVSGTAANKQTWTIVGTKEVKPGGFTALLNYAVQETFEGLTNGKAVFGNPGVGCSGPYKITRLVIELSEQSPSES
jgi:hypothetical protein